jgi:hypothetical protein
MINTTKPLIVKIRDLVFDFNLYDFYFYEKGEDNKQITLYYKTIRENHSFYFLKNNFDEMKEYDIIKENILRILKPIDLSAKLPEVKEDKYNPGA